LHPRFVLKPFTNGKDVHEFLKRRKEFMKGLFGRLKKELAPGRREAVNINQLKKVDILKGRVEGELQSILEYFEEKMRMREPPYAKRAQTPIDSVSSKREKFL
jgi:hypothetical protein